MLRISTYESVIRFDLARTLAERGRYWTTAYLFDGLLIDTGCAHTAREFVKELESTPIKRIVNTHSHEDHIGAVPFLLKETNVPVYGTHFTLALLERKLQEHGLLDSAALHSVEPRERVALDQFEVEWIHVSHSLTSCAALAISTPVGVVIHSGDFKIDESPVIGSPTDLERLSHGGPPRGARPCS